MEMGRSKGMGAGRRGESDGEEGEANVTEVERRCEELRG
jgi:hypothetical protein